MDELANSSGGQLNIAHRHRAGWAVVEISGPLLWPPAAQLTEFVPFLAPAVLLDLTGVTSIDSTGVAVLASITAQLEHAGCRVRVVVADDQLRRRLPRTAGLQDTYSSVDDAIGSGAGAPENRP